ncbi:MULTISPECIES: conjugal transfer protein TraX [unclassified Clostridium]|uniref:conjugal transfer protein TraX n=1 Tax=unclassified Clostridium TaxID=2614128 RepID=UPI00215B6F4E|nr:MULTISPECIES: conjugal transfer protein TraX [unclassified Clostridium]
MKKLDAFQLKIIALIVMLMDHLYFAFGQVFPLWFHPLSRFVAPLFAFLMVEGLFHTKNKFKYNIRLFGWPVFMQAENFVINRVLGSAEFAVHNN